MHAGRVAQLEVSQHGRHAHVPGALVETVAACLTAFTFAILSEEDAPQTKHEDGVALLELKPLSRRHVWQVSLIPDHLAALDKCVKVGQIALDVRAVADIAVSMCRHRAAMGL